MGRDFCGVRRLPWGHDDWRQEAIQEEGGEEKVEEEVEEEGDEEEGGEEEGGEEEVGEEEGGEEEVDKEEVDEEEVGEEEVGEEEERSEDPGDGGQRECLHRRGRRRGPARRLPDRLEDDARGHRRKTQDVGKSIVGFGSYTYTYASGHSGEWPIAGFSPRKTDLTLYIMPGFDRAKGLMKRLGKHKTGKSCLYIKRLDHVDQAVLRELIVGSVAEMRRRYP